MPSESRVEADPQLDRVIAAREDALQAPSSRPSARRWRSSAEPAPRVQVLTSSLGAGHLSAAQAIELALRERWPHAHVQLVDFWSLMDWRVARVVRHSYLRLVQDNSELYDSVYRLDQGIWRQVFEGTQAPPAVLNELFTRLLSFAREESQATLDRNQGERYFSDRLLFRQLCSSLPSSTRRTVTNNHAWVRLALAKWCWTRLARRLENRVLAFRPDVVIATQMGPSALLARAKARRALATPVIAVPTDFGVHDFWIQPSVDRYCLAHESVFNQDRIDADEVHVTGIPLMPDFRNPPSREQARIALGLAQSRPVLLILGGGLGLGVEHVTEKLLETTEGTQIVTLTGHNADARTALGPLVARYPGRLHVHAWTDRMATFMRAADVVVGKLGGLTLAETFACGRPLLATRTLGGQEGFNQRFLELHGAGSLISEADLVAKIRALLEQPERLAQLQQRAESLGRGDGAARIAALAETLIHSQTRQTALRDPG